MLTEAEKLQWQYEEEQKRTQEQWMRTQEQKKRLEEVKRATRVNVRTATIAELRTIPRVDQYRAQQIQAAVRFGLVRKFDGPAEDSGHRLGDPKRHADTSVLGVILVARRF